MNVLSNENGRYVINGLPGATYNISIKAIGWKAEARRGVVIAEIAPHDSVERFSGLGVNVIQGAARFTSRNEVEAAYRRTDFLGKRRLLMREWAVFCKKTFS